MIPDLLSLEILKYCPLWLFHWPLSELIREKFYSSKWKQLLAFETHYFIYPRRMLFPVLCIVRLIQSRRQSPWPRTSHYNPITQRAQTTKTVGIPDEKKERSWEQEESYLTFLVGVKETQHEKCLGLTLRCSSIRGILLRSSIDGDRFKCEEYGQGVRMVEKNPWFCRW